MVRVKAEYRRRWLPLKSVVLTCLVALCGLTSSCLVLSRADDEDQSPDALGWLSGETLKHQGALGATSTAGPARGPITSPPSGAETSTAEKTVREAYRADIAGVQDSQDREKLVMELIASADAPATREADRYAVLKVAVEIAEAGDDARLVRKVSEVFSEWFTDQDSLGSTMAFLLKAEADGRHLPADWIDVVVEVATAAVDSSNVTCASKGVGLAGRLLRKSPANVADRVRPTIQRLESETNDIRGVHDKAAAARNVLLNAKDDPRASTTLGFFSALNGDWKVALDNLAKGQDDAFKAAASVELALAQAPLAEDLFGCAGKWWESCGAGNAGGGFLNGDPPVLPSPMVQSAIRRHSAHMYERALEIAPGLASPIHLKVAKSRVAETRALEAERLRPVARIAGFGAPQLPVAAAPQQFNQQVFSDAEDEREELFAKLNQAAGERGQRRLADIQRQLINNREKWCGALHLFNRDAALAQRQALISNILQRDPRFADGWLCDCYLKMLDGDARTAKESLSKAWDLMQGDPDRQLYSGGQLLDAGQAALALGDTDRAEKIRNVLKKRFANHPGVLFLEAKLFTKKNLFTDALKNFEKLLKQGNGHPLILADYAWMRAASPVAGLRDRTAAAKAAEDVLASPSGPHWLAWRSKAAVLASESKWDEAIAALKTAVSQAPLLHSDEMETQRKKYLAKEEYFIERGR